MYFINVLGLVILNILCFYAAYTSIEYTKKELLKVTANKERLSIFTWLTYSTFVLQILPWLGLWINYYYKEGYSASVIENFWVLTRMTLFSVLVSLFFLAIPIILGEDKEFLKRFQRKPRN